MEKTVQHSITGRSARLQDDAAKPFSGVQHVPLIPKNPTERGELSIQHSPFKVIPGAEPFEAVFFLQAPGGFPRALPDVALTGALWISDGIGFVFNELDFTAFDFF